MCVLYIQRYRILRITAYVLVIHKNIYKVMVSGTFPKSNPKNMLNFFSQDNLPFKSKQIYRTKKEMQRIVIPHTAVVSLYL